MNSRYYLINNKGTRLELCSLEITRGHPENFYAIDYEIIRYKDDADFEINQQDIKFTPFDLTLNFRVFDYEQQRSFIDFFDTNDEMLLEKEVLATNQSYLRRVIFKSGNQTPVQQVEGYVGSVTVTALSQWFQDEVSEIVTTETTTSTYPLTYPIVYGTIGQGETTIFNDFNTRVPLIIEFIGVADNPTWSLENPVGTVLYEGKINFTSGANEKIVIDSARGTVELRSALDNSFISNIFQNQDFTLDTWTTLDTKGEFKFSIAHDGLGVLRCNVNYRKIRPIV